MGTIYRIYFYLVSSYLLFILFKDFRFTTVTYIFIYFISLTFYIINRDWFDSRPFKQTFIIILTTMMIGAASFKIELITKPILFIVAFLLFIISGSVSQKEKIINEVHFKCKNCLCINNDSSNEVNKLQVKKCTHCHYYNFIKVDENNEVDVVRSIPNEPLHFYQKKNKVNALSTKPYSIILTILLLLSLYY